jgi:hypothetical protein
MRSQIQHIFTLHARQGRGQPPVQALANRRSYLNLQRLLASRPSCDQNINMCLWARIKRSCIYTCNKWTLNLQATPLEDYQHRTWPPHWEPTTIKRAPHATSASSLPHRLCCKPAHKTSARKTYDHPVCPPCIRRFPQGRPTTIQRVPHATGSLQVHTSDSLQVALFRANSP